MSKSKILIIGSKENKKLLLKGLNLKNSKVIFHDEDKRKISLKNLNLKLLYNIVKFAYNHKKYSNKYALSKKNFLYIICLILSVKPKIVISLNDVSNIYHTVVANFPDIRCIAIQNGNRTKFGLSSKFNHDIYFSFSEYEKNLFDDLKIKYKKIIPIGSFYGELKKLNTKNSYKSIYDLCFISQYSERHFQNKNKIFQLKTKNIIILCKFLSKLVKKTNLKLCILLRENSINEINFYKEFFKKNSKNISFIKCYKNTNTFKYMFQSKVCTSFYSSTIKELLPLRKKAFFMDFTNSDKFNKKSKSLIIFREQNFKKFNSFFLKILNMNNNMFYKSVFNEIQFYMKDYNFVKPSSIINEEIKKILNNEKKKISNKIL